MSSQRTPWIVALGWVISLSIVIAGCGGGSPTTNPVANRPDRSAEAPPDGNRKAEGQSGRLGVFLTATPDTRPQSPTAHTWATLLKVELIDVQEKPVTIFETQDGATINLASLQDDSGKRYVPLTCASVPSGKAYLRVRLTFDKALYQFTPDAVAGEALPLSDTLGRDEQERPMLSFALNRPRDLGNGKENLVIEFDTAKWERKENRLIPAVKEGAVEGLADYSRQIPATFRGTVRELTAAEGQTGTLFTLETGTNRSVSVQAGEATIYENDGAAPNPALGEAKRITVRGTLTPDTHRILAHRIIIQGENPPDGDSVTVRGIAGSLDSSSHTFVVTVTQVDGLPPTFARITVVLPPDAPIRSRGGLLLKPDGFAAALQANPTTPVLVEGTYEPVTGTLRARRAAFEEMLPPTAREAEIQGTPQNPDENARSFTMTAPTLWQGIAVSTGGKENKGVPVQVTAATEFRDEQGQFIASPSFWAAAKAGEKSVRVVGIYGEGKLTATRLELGPPPAKAPASEEKTAQAAASTASKPSTEAAKSGTTEAPAKTDEKPAEPGTQEPEKPTPPAEEKPPVPAPEEPAEQV